MSNEYKIKYSNGKNKLEHRVIVEEKLGRKLLKNESVHHINGDKRDNRIENLVVMNKAEHHSLHMKGNTFEKRNKKKMVRFDIRIQQDHYTQLKAIAGEYGQISDLIRRAVDNYIQSQQQLLVSKSPTKK